MAKKHLYFNEAERLYTIEQNTISEIIRKLPISVGTAAKWCKDGDWENKRLQYLESKTSFHEELYEFSRHLMKSIKTDMENGQKVDANRMYTLGRILPLIIKIKDYEDVTQKLEKDDDDEKPINLSDNVIQLIEKNILGLNKKTVENSSENLPAQK